MSSLITYLSGCKKKKIVEESVKSQSSSLFRYFKKPKPLRTDEVDGIEKVDKNKDVDGSAEIDGVDNEYETRTECDTKSLLQREDKSHALSETHGTKSFEFLFVMVILL